MTPVERMFWDFPNRIFSPNFALYTWKYNVNSVMSENKVIKRKNMLPVIPFFFSNDLT